MNVSPASRARPRERRVLREEPVAGVDRVGAGPARGVDDGVDAQVALRGRARADVDRLVGFAHVPRVAIAVGVDGDRRQAHLAARADDPDGDLAAVGDQDFHRSCRLPVAGVRRSAGSGKREASQRNIPVLLRRVLVALGLERRERGDQLGRGSRGDG